VTAAPLAARRMGEVITILYVVLGCLHWELMKA
jgi:hypothetical protein